MDNYSTPYEEELTLDTLKSKYLDISASKQATDLLFRRYTNYEPIKIPTGFNDLDAVLNGGLRASLYVVGADTGLGKTSLILQIANNIAERGYPVYYVSLEMAREELVAKQVSRLTYEKSIKLCGKPDYAKTHLKILDTQDYKSYSPEQKDIVDKALDEVERHTTKLFIEEGVADIDVENIRQSALEIKNFVTAEKDKYIELVTDSYKDDLKGVDDEEERKAILAEYQEGIDKLNAVYNTPVIIVDYLQILQPTEEYRRNTEKQIMDYNVVALKRLSRDLQTPVIAISSFNRDSYGEPVTLKAFKESGAIEYTSDVVIGLQLNGVEYEDKETQGSASRKARIRKLIDYNNTQARNGCGQLLDIKILKNRHGHKGSLPITFVPMFNYFEEIDEDKADYISSKINPKKKSYDAEF